MRPRPAAPVEALRPSSEPTEEQPVAVRIPTDVRSIALTILAAIAAVVFLKYAEAMLVPLVLGLLISYALNPAVGLIVRLRLPRVIASAIVLGAVVAGSGALVYELRSEAEDIIRQLPEGARKLRRTLERNGQSQTSPITHVQQAATELEKAANGSATRTPAPPGVQRVQVESTPFRVSDYLLWGSLGVAEAATQLLMVLFLSFFLLASGDLHRRKLVKIVGPSLGKKKVTVQILEEISQRIESFLLVQLATSIIVGVATWLAFRWIGLQQAAVWGVLAGVFNSIPYFGPVIVTGGTATIAFLQFGTLSMALWTGAASLTITSLEGYLLTPWLTSRAARMNAVAVFVGLLFWGWVWNIWGLLLAVPMLMMIKVVCDHIEDFKPVGELMGD